MLSFWYLGMRSLSGLPTLLVLLTGLVLAARARRRLPRRPRALLHAGLAALLVDVGLGVAYAMLLPRLVANGWARESGMSVMQLAMLVGLLRVLLAPLGLALLIAAALAGRGVPAPASPAAWGDWAPPPAGPEAEAAAATDEETGTAVAAGPGAAEPRSGGDFPPLPAPADQDGTR